MIGHYVHHHGSGHLQRARTLAAALPWPVTGLSSLPRPQGWEGEWVLLPRDDDDPQAARHDPTVRGRLHWAPRGDRGLLDRQAAVSGWLRGARPRLMVVDQSVEVSLLARLHGVRVLGFTAPGRRNDAPHELGFAGCDTLLGAWPNAFTADLLPGADPDAVARFTGIGAVSRFGVTPPPARRRASRRAVLMCGDGGDSFDGATVDRMRDATPQWEWTVLSRRLGTWVSDPAGVLAGADVVVTHAGQNAVAEVASLRVPAVVVPEPRPFDEQQVMAGVLGRHMPVVALPHTRSVDWADVLDRAHSLDGSLWETWADGLARSRYVRTVQALLDEDA